MNIGLYFRGINAIEAPQLQRLQQLMTDAGINYCRVDGNSSIEYLDMVLSIGGDGTLLSCVHCIGYKGVPVVGVNFGHLGFLTSAGQGNLEELVEDLRLHRYSIEERSLLKVKVRRQGQELVEDEGFVLNEVSLHRRDAGGLLNTHVYVQNLFVSTYSGDGLIVATPTGSTAYSLSCGGPILTPDSGCFVITPVAAHSLTLRPIIVPDDVELHLLTEGRDPMFSLGLDSRTLQLPIGSEVWLCKESFCLSLVRTHGENFFSAMREKMRM